MFVIRLPNGNLRVPETAIGHEGRVIGNAYVEISPQDADYARLAAQAVTPEEAEQRRNRWRAGDEALRQQFLEFARTHGDSLTHPDLLWPDADGPADTRDLTSSLPWLRPIPTIGRAPGQRHRCDTEVVPTTWVPRRCRCAPRASRHGCYASAAGCPCVVGSVSPRSSARTSDSRNRRCPPGVRILVIRPEAAHLVTVFGSTRNRAATSPGVSKRSLLPSTFSLLRLCLLSLRSGIPLVWRSTSTFCPDFRKFRSSRSVVYANACVSRIGTRWGNRLSGRLFSDAARAVPSRPRT
jgi:hypothetical protein